MSKVSQARHTSYDYASDLKAVHQSKHPIRPLMLKGLCPGDEKPKYDGKEDKHQLCHARLQARTSAKVWEGSGDSTRRTAKRG